MADRILVTGSSGFVGRAFVRSARDAGALCVAMVRDNHRGTDFGDETVYGDVLDRDFCQRVIADYEINAIVHLAAQAIVSACAEDPLSALEIGVMGTARLLQAVRDSGRKIVTVVSTSDKVYGSAPSPYTESTPLDARHAYEVSKACQDLVARMFHSNFDVDVRVLRAVNIYGPGDPNESRLIPRTVRRCLAGDRPLVHAGAADMRRQYVYIDDLVAAIRTVGRVGAAGEAYCVGSPDPAMTVLDVVQEIARQTGQDPAAIETGARGDRFREIQEQSIDDSKLRSIGWAPSTRFGDGIANTIAWYRR
jgi:CDP-glucose 4,6-dehydratase